MRCYRSNRQFANVIVDISVEKLDKTFQYRIPEELKAQVRVGVQADIPFGNRTLTGYVVELTDVPEYSVAFLQWSMVQSLFAVFDSSLYIALYAKGQLRENALLSPSIGFLVVPLEYILFRYGYSPMVVAYLLTGVYAMLGLIIKPVLICRIANYRYADIFRMFVRCGIVTLLSLGSVYLLITGIDVNTYKGFGEICVITFISNLVIISCFGLKKDEREMIMKAVRKKFAKLL